ncbi:MAG: NAD(P)/FAD-dependent oxidoreductase, partial [Lactobacillus sp.]|nr:NAD(P)/FAD-dependent oxidoreductase [Lactobacillus sp.]
IVINLAPETDFQKLLKEKRESSKGLKISSILNKHFPASMVEFFVGGKDVFVSEISNKSIIEIAGRINNWKVKPAGSQGFKSAEVTIGGVDVNEIKPETMESLKVEGLFFVGEVLDVTGQLGGYNLQWAWSSGYAAGKDI